MVRVRFRRLSGGVIALAFALLALVSPRPARAEPGDELTVYVITFGPGDHPFYKFGHDAIWIHDSSASPRDRMRRDPVYNWGTFAFGDPALIPKFVTGRFLYWLSKAPIDWTVKAYQQENRSVVAQELNLTAAQKKMLRDLVEENAKDENKYYKYDYYRDNCATRVRDMIDKAVGGKLHEASKAPASMTWRQHTLRLTADDKVLSLALSVVMGSLIDKPLDQWEEMFLPAYVQQGLRRVTVPGPDGKEIPLVKSEKDLAVATGRAPLRTEPPSWGLVMFLVGAALGGAVFLSARASAKKALGPRIALGALLFVEGFLSILGALFVIVWFATDHEVGYHNENILQLAPWCVPLLGFSIGVARLKPRSIRRARLVVTAAAAASLFGLAWKVLPWMRQDNYWFIAFAAPMWIGSTLGLRKLEAALAGAPAKKDDAAPEKSAKPGKKKAVKKEEAESDDKAPPAADAESAASDADANAPVDTESEKN
ncbi:MAG: DUF4105 domain-containing protein [Polyangiaceae bacterium]